MDIKSLQYFHYIAKYRNITNAAKQLYVSQSTLSRHIMALENELGVKLFERNNKQIDLTEAGKAFYKDSSSFINHMETVIKNVQSADKGHSGILRITMPSQLYYILSKPLSLISGRYPDIRLVIESYLFDEIPNAIQHDLYNVGLTYDFAAQTQEGIDSIPIATEDFSLVVPARFLVDNHHMSLADMTEIVKKLPLTLPAHVEPPFMKKLLSVFQEHAGARIIKTCYVNTTESVIMNTSLGLCYSIVPTSWSNSHYANKDVTFLHLPELQAQCDIVMLYKKANLTSLTDNFITIVKNFLT